MLDRIPSKSPPGGKALVKIYPKGLQKSIELISLKTVLILNKIFRICNDTLLILRGATSFNILDNPLGTAIIIERFY